MRLDSKLRRPRDFFKRPPHTGAEALQQQRSLHVRCTGGDRDGTAVEDPSATRRQLQLTDREPGREEVKRPRDLCPTPGRKGAGRQPEVDRVDAPGLVPLDAQPLDRAPETEPRSEPSPRELIRAPVVVRRIGVVRIRHRAEIWDRRRPRPCVLDRLGAAAGARGVVRPRNVSVPRQDLAERRVHRLVRARLLRRDPAVDLIGRRGDKVVEGVRPELVHRIGARGDGLGLERRERPV